MAAAHQITGFVVDLEKLRRVQIQICSCVAVHPFPAVGIPLTNAAFLETFHIAVLASLVHISDIAAPMATELTVPTLALGIPADHIARLAISFPEHASIGRRTVKIEDIYLHDHEIPSEANHGPKRHLAFSNISYPYQTHTGQTPHAAYFTRLPITEVAKSFGLLLTKGLA